VRFYWCFYKAAIRARAAYRVDFAVGMIATLLMQVAALCFLWVVQSWAPALGGWSSAHVLFLFGVTAMALALSEVLFNGIWQLPSYVVLGQLDRLLVYPVRGLLFLLIARPELHSIGNFVSGAVMVGFAFESSAPPTLAYLLLPVWVVSASLVYTSVLVLLGALSFTVTGPAIGQYFFALHLLNATRYPVHVYPAWLKAILLWVLPVGAATYLPGLWLHGSGSLLVAAVVPPLIAVAATLLASAAWSIAIRRYQSTGT
jgi:ABC-2 type transport system permease protein